ncbi:MAG: FHA domain-containing protein, partial [Cyanobacteria bacterium P01_A01_bin.40]
STGLQQYIELDINREYSIGRSPESEITIDGKLYQGVSWNHGAILPLVELGQETQWQICDYSSTNGTFVNGQRVADSQWLTSGDIITLACPQSAEKIAELAFKIRGSAVDTEVDQEYWEVVDSDLLMVVVDSRQQLTSQVKHFIQNLDQTYLSQQFLLIDTPDPQQEPEIAQDAESNLKVIEAWIQGAAKDKGFELVPLYLQPFYTEDSQKEIDPRQLKKQSSFAKILGNIVKRQPENILAKRIGVKVVRAAEPVEPFLSQQQQEVAEKLAQEEQELKALEQVNLKEIGKKTIAEAHQTKDRFFKQIKLDLNQSKAAFLDVYSKRSLIYQIQDFVNGLNPVVSKQNGQKIIQLTDDAANCDDINPSLVDFCTDSLEQWATEEWYKIIHVYGNGGLSALLDRLSEKTNTIPQALAESPFDLPDEINLQDNFLMSFAGTNCATSHRQMSLGAYIMKQLRSQMMQIMMMLTLVLGFVGIKSSRNQMTQGLSNYFQQYPWLFGLFVFGIIFLLVNGYNSENDLKLDEAAVKLKKDLSSYYQAFSKNLIDKVVQDITLNLELEDKKIADGLQIVSEAYSDRMMEVEKKQIQIKHNLEQYRAQQQSLNTDVAEFEKLKQM